MEEENTKDLSEASCELIYDTADDLFFDNPCIELQKHETNLSKIHELEKSVVEETIDFEIKLNPNHIKEKNEKLIEIDEQLRKAKCIEVCNEASNIAYLKQINALEQDQQDIKKSLTNYVLQYELLHQEKLIRNKEVKEISNSFKIVMLHYKKNLQIYVNIEQEERLKKVNVYFFTDQHSEDYFISLVLNTNNWSLQSTTPNLPEEEFKLLQETLKVTNDIASILVTIRKKFVMMKYGNV